jgi:protein-disulfide isomerase
VIPGLVEQYVDTGKVRYVYREFPLTDLHPAAQKASEAALCAGEQGSYWEMNELLFERQSEWSQAEEPSASFKGYAEELGLETSGFNDCLDSGETEVIVQGDGLAGQSLGVSATPYFFINDLPIRGGLSLDRLGQIIDYTAAGGEPPQIVPPAGDVHLLGDTQTARAITVAFVDYSSPESAQHALEVLPKLEEEYIETGQLVYVLHPWVATMDSPGAQAAIAAECAGEQGAYWEMHDWLFEQQSTWNTADDSTPLFVDAASALDLDTAQFEECLDSEWASLRVQAGSGVAALYGVPGAPVFLFNNGQGQQGSPSLEEFETIIDSILNQ